MNPKNVEKTPISGASDAYSVSVEDDEWPRAMREHIEQDWVSPHPHADPQLPLRRSARAQVSFESNQTTPSAEVVLTKRDSIKVLEECMDLQNRKSQDYQNPNSNVLQAMHYRCGINTLQDVMQTKLYRAQSLLETAENPGSTLEVTPNFESLEDTYKDLINYASFAVAWLRGGIPGQRADRDIFNKIIPDDLS